MAVTTEPAWINFSSGIAGKNGSSAHTINFGWTSTSGSFLLFIVGGAVTHEATGWTERLSPVNETELSAFTRTSSGQSSITVTHNGSDYAVAWAAYEFPAGTTWITGVQNSINWDGDAFPALSGLSGVEQVVFAARTWVVTETAPVTNETIFWSPEFIEDVDTAVARNGTDGVCLVVAHRLNVVVTDITPSAQSTTTSVAGSREQISFSLNVASNSSNVTVTPSGIATGAVVPTGVNVSISGGPITVMPESAIAGGVSGAVVGTPDISSTGQFVEVVGIPTAVAVGSPSITLTSTIAQPVGIASGQSFGLLTVNYGTLSARVGNSVVLRMYLGNTLVSGFPGA